MSNQKIENILNLALEVTDEEREKSEQLEVGFRPQDREWELIIKYIGSLERVREISVNVSELLGGYAIVVVKESQVNELAALPEVEYIEKPKRLYFQVNNGKRVSCINEVQDMRFSLFGQEVLIGIVDSGIDYTLDDFKNADGTTRIVSLWDQSLEADGEERVPEAYGVGVEYSLEEINNELLEDSSIESEMGDRVRVRSLDFSGHGTAVAGIAAGSGTVYRGVAPESELIIVKMDNPDRNGFPRTTELMMGIDYVIRKAMELGKPVAINVSFGNTYGSHNGTSLLERYLDDVSGIWKSVICVGTGNEAASAGHTSGILREDEETIVELAVQDRQPSFGVQIWKEYTDEAAISLISPSGVRVGPIQEVLGSQQFTVGQTQILLYYGEPSPYSTSQEIYLDFIPMDDYVDAGVWRIELRPGKIVSGRYDLWLPSEAALNRGTAFLFPTDDTTITIPSTASRVISVGAYDALTFAYADFSGRGTGNVENAGRNIEGNIRPGSYQKPDLAAPGVDVTTVAAGGGYASFSGTSFATPFVTGAAALLMEWGIVKGNDPYLYGEKVKAYLRRGAKPLPGFTQYPNPLVGYGALCVEESLPR